MQEAREATETIKARQKEESGMGQSEVTTPHTSPCKHKTETQEGSAHLVEAGRAARGRATGEPLPIAFIRSPGGEREEEQKGLAHLMETS